MEIQQSLYESIGFNKMNALVLPQEIARWKITNPDAVINNYYFETVISNNEYKVVPLLLASSKYDEKKGGEFFDYLTLNFIAIEDNNGKAIPIIKNGSYVIFSISKITNYFEEVGENTDYIIHPEEILADNFVLLVNKSENIKTKKVLDSIEQIIRN